MPYIIFADLETLIKKNRWMCKQSSTKIGEHIPCRYSTSTIWAFNNIENKHILYLGEALHEKGTCLREHATNVTNFEKKCYLQKMS